MINKEAFASKFNTFVSLVNTSKQRMSREEVEEFFREDELTQAQMNMVMDYLDSTKPQQEVAITPEDEEYVEEYLEMLEEIPKEIDGERQSLCAKVIEGDSLAKNRLIELYLPEVVKIARNMYQPGNLLSDLIQEGNVGLTLGVASIKSDENVYEQICACIEAQISQLLEEEELEKNADKEMVKKVERLDECLTMLQKDLGRKVTIGELADEMGLTDQEVLDILKLAGEDINDKEEQEHMHHHHHE